MNERSVVHLLRSRTDGTYDVGWTTHLVRRLVEHNTGRVPFTQRKRPWQLVGFEICKGPAEAKARGFALKHNPRMLQLFKKRVLNRVAFGHPQQVGG